ncbi:MAG: hypothetical protein ACFFA8_07590 [Promethearchaeota archaeon]
MSGVNLIIKNIKEEITNPKPSSNRIITYLHDLRTKEEYQSLSNVEFYDIVGETFKLNPEYFMKRIYGKYFHNREMEKYIIRKFCLYDGEQIIYECDGSIRQRNQDNVKVSVLGRIYITNYRIIAQGTLSVSGGRLSGGGNLLDLVIPLMTGRRKRTKSKKGLIEGSTYQELPCYGYQFPIRNHVKLKKKGDGIRYIVTPQLFFKLRNVFKVIQISLGYPLEDKINKLFQVLSKDVNQIIDSFRELHEMGLNRRSKKKEFIYRLRQLWKSEEYQQLFDSNYLDVVIRVYELDPEFFMTSIYPKMMSWKFPSFVRVKEEIISLIDKLNSEFVPSKPETDENNDLDD